MNKIVNGETVPMTPEEIAEWEAGQSNTPLTLSPSEIISAVKQTVAAIPLAVIKRYPGIVGDVGKYLDEGNLVGAAQLLALFVADMQAANDTEALSAAEPVIQMLNAL